MTSARTSPAGDVDYQTFGKGYGQQRRADPRIEALVQRALAQGRSVLNVGAGSGSYEPEDRWVIAIEPSAAMRAQRSPERVPAIDAAAESLPLDDQSVDAAMALVTVHQWRDLEKGLSELRRVCRGPIVILTFDGEALERFWLADFAPELIAVERRRYPSMERLSRGLGGKVSAREVEIPIDCTDGFTEAFYARPEAFLQEHVRRSQSAWSFVPEDVQARIVRTLGDSLSSGEWDRRYGEWRKRPSFAGSLRLVVSEATDRRNSGL